MASSAGGPAPTTTPGSASTESGSTVLFVIPSGVPTIPATVEKIGNRRDLTHGFHLGWIQRWLFGWWLGWILALRVILNAAMEDQYMEDMAFGARFDDTDDEEKNENDDGLVLADYEGEDLPTIEWSRGSLERRHRVSNDDGLP
ncbi:hypothetical protein QYE76_046351 [Lolium multiflorum]|uniref:Uncharacterized protein n=1 Tax=Lolium multiflorum TaxID=4521 RepID=A0AAD8X102_LOLMU|nr:hypothetical protein QYE76_046351 [Lolium multiflorum]